jgi:hypothetical protein
VHAAHSRSPAPTGARHDTHAGGARSARSSLAKPVTADRHEVQNGR